MEHKGTINLETKRLLLRKFEEKDIKPAFQNWTNDNKVTKYLTWPSHGSIEVTEKVIKDWIKNYSDKSFYQWAIVLKEINEPIGSISVVDINEKAKSLHIGYCIGSKWWNKGYTSEAFLGIIPFLFEEVKALRIDSKHDTKNPNSGKVMAKCGLKFEGILKNADWNNTGIVDAAYYGLLAEDYFRDR